MTLLHFPPKSPAACATVLFETGSSHTMTGITPPTLSPVIIAMSILVCSWKRYKCTVFVIIILTLLYLQTQFVRIPLRISRDNRSGTLSERWFQFDDLHGQPSSWT